MFAFLAIELSVLFIGISLLVGVLQRHIPPSKVEALLPSSGKRGYFLAAGLGAITPFCSCSTIPMLKGLIRARAGFGPMMVFLFSSPLLNPIVVGLLVATFGWTLTAIYVLAALVVAVGAGWLLHTLGFERYVRRTATQREVDVVHQQARAVLHRPHRGCGTNSCDTTPKTASCGADRKTTVSTSSECCDSQPTVTVRKKEVQWCVAGSLVGLYRCVALPAHRYCDWQRDLWFHAH
ncbi:permease [Pseudomonas aeruginosa]